MKTNPIPELKTQLSILPAVLAASALSLANALAFIDSDSNGLDDVWETIYFGALGNDPNADPDGDSRSNLDECNATTDPLDLESRLEVVDFEIYPTDARISWMTMLGKKYRVQFSGDLQDWSQQLTQGGSPVDFQGNGGKLILDLSDPANPLIKGGATREVWLGLGNGNVNNFKTTILNWTDANTPAAPAVATAPSGTELTERLQAPTNYGDQYGQRLRGFITPSETGDHTFYIAGRHQCEFWLSTVDGSTSPADLNLVLRQTNNSIVTPEDWTYYATNGIAPDDQKSAPVALTAGEMYYFEVLHRHSGREDHLAVGWTKPSDGTGDIEVVPGENICAAVDLSDTNAPAIIGTAGNQFVRVSTFAPGSAESYDTDGDGIDDGTENLLASYNPFESNSSGHATGDDSDSVDDALAATTETISAAVIDGSAREDNGFQGNGVPRLRDVLRFTLSRVGTLKPLTVFYNLGGGDDMVDGSPQEENGAEPGDYNEEDINGAPLAGFITFPAGSNLLQIVLDPANDGIYEYPETVSLTIDDTEVDYTVDPGNQRVEALIYDQRNEVENEILFVGFSLPHPDAGGAKGSAICSGKLSANRDQLTLFTSITANFSSPQNNSHVHKDVGNPGADPIAFSLPQVGEIGPLDWPLHDNGGFTPKKMIDSLFNQVDESTTPGETRLYINWHTNNNPGGELYAFLSPATGSVDPPIPDDPPAIVQFDPVTQEKELRREITRFLTQSTFGPTEALVDDLYNRVLNEPGNDRIQVFGDWIDEQLDTALTPQSTLLDYCFAADWQELVLRGYYDPTFFEQSDWGVFGPPELRNPPEPAISALTLPGSWPYVMPKDENTINYAVHDVANGPPRPSAAYPVSQSFISSVHRPQQLGLGRVWRESPRRGIWTIMMNAKDQVRQRLAFALSQIVVISAEDTKTRNHYYGRARYWDMLAENADDTYRELLEAVTYSPMMGQYLSHLKNRKEADLDNDGIPDVFADENYAREIMQLFSIGLVQMHLDGSLALSAANGLPQATYDNTDITELSRVMTGLSISRYSDHTNWDNPVLNNNFDRVGDQRFGSTHDYPMRMFGSQHDVSSKTIVGGLVVNNTAGDTTARGNADLADVHDWLAGSGAAPYDGYPSTPPFIARRLIQRLVSSNPPRDYVYRVAKAFHDSGGNIKETAKAILLDYHARSFEVIDITYGRKKPPLMAYVQASRALGGQTNVLISELGNGAGDSSDYGLPLEQVNNYTGNASRFRYQITNNNLSMAPMHALTVFNFYLPDYTPPVGGIAAAGMVGPEFQILDETSVIQNINYFRTLTWSGGTNAGQGLTGIANATYNGYTSTDDNNRLDRDGWIAKYNAYTGAEWERDKQLIDALDEILNAGWLQRTYTLDPADRGDGMVADPIRNPYESIIDALTKSYGTSVNDIRDKVRLAFYLMTTTSPFMVQK